MSRSSIGVTAWRLTIAAAALSGVALAAHRYDVWWTALSQLACLVAGLYYLSIAAWPALAGRTEPRSPWLRGALTAVLLMVATAYLPMQNGNLTAPFSILEHVVVPVLVLLDFLLVGDNQRHLRWWHPISWLLAPLAYVGYYVSGDLAVYAALDIRRPVEFAARLSVLAVVLLVCGYALYAVGRGRRIVHSRP